MKPFHLLTFTWGTYILGLGGTITLYIVAKAFYNAYMHPLARFPGPKLAACTRLWIFFKTTGGKYPFINRKLHERYGDVVRIAPDELSFANVDSWVDIYGHAAKGKSSFSKAPSYDAIEYPNVIMARNVDEHRKQRKSLSHAFSAKALREQEPIIQHYIDKFVDGIGKWSDREGGLDIVEGFHWVTFDIISHLTYGESFGAVDEGKTHPWVSTLMGHVRHLGFMGHAVQMPLLRLLLPFVVPLEVVKSFKKSRQYTKEKVASRVARQEQITHTDFFKHILEKAEMPTEGLESNAQVLILAGSETTSTALSAALYYLSQHSECLGRLQDEIRGKFTSLEQITGDSTIDMPYLNAVIEEALRIFPPTPVGFQRTSPGAIVGGHYVPEGTIVSTNFWATSHDKRYWKDPDTFRPERWLGDGIGDNKQAFNPFLIGPRACLGINLAYMEMRSILAKMVMAYDWEYLRDVDWLEQCMSYQVWQKPELPMKFHSRL